jgi:hypothetical protein
LNSGFSFFTALASSSPRFSPFASVPSKISLPPLLDHQPFFGLTFPLRALILDGKEHF